MALSKAKMSNELPKKTTSKIMVAAIDFGTTYSGWAFSFYSEYKKEPTKAFCKSWNSGKHISLKAPTTVLINPDGKTIEAFGYEAEDSYAQLVDDNEHESYYYFQRFKMLLYDNKTLKRNETLEDTNGKRLPAKTVFSLVIRFLRQDLLKEANAKLSGGVEENDIQWVLTVPAIWNYRAKQFMRECAIEAGIKSNDLLIALEPEVASLYCKQLEIHRENECTSDGSMLSSFEPGAQYMLVDAGGGTVDVIVHKVTTEGSLEEISASSGGNWGGTNVDMAFLKLISQVYGEIYIERLKDEHIDDYLELLREIEIKKRSIVPGMKSKLKLKVPVILNEMYTADKNESITERIKRQQRLNRHVTFKTDKILFDPDLMESIFSETTVKVVDHLKTILNDVPFRKTDVILMVGGFSESPMLFNAVQTAFKMNNVIIPSDAGLSVLKGAVIFGHSRKGMEVRVSPYTYGFSLLSEYDQTRYDDSHLVTDKNGVTKVDDTFCRLITIKERVPCDNETPSKNAVPQKEMQGFTLRLFSSKERDPLYVDDSSCDPIGEVYVDCRDDTGNVGGAFISLKFGGAEVEARAILKSNNKLTSTSFNFLD